MVCAGHIGQIVGMDNVVEAQVADFAVAEAQHLPPPGIEGDNGQVQLVLGLEHDLLLGHLEEGGRPERRADAEEGQRRVLRFPILPVQRFDSTPNVQALKRKK